MLLQGLRIFPSHFPSHFLTQDLDDCDQPQHSKTILIVDGNSLYHSVRDVPETMKGVAEKIFGMIPGNSDVIFSTDSYKAKSIKASERQRIGVVEQLLIKGHSMKHPSDWKGFLSNHENKRQFNNILLNVWSEDNFSSVLKDRKVKERTYYKQI